METQQSQDQRAVKQDMSPKVSWDARVFAFQALVITFVFCWFAMLIAGFLGIVLEFIFGLGGYFLMKKKFIFPTPSYLLAKVRALPFIGFMVVGIAVIAIGKVIIKG